jgi:hypothetical protein
MVTTFSIIQKLVTKLFSLEALPDFPRLTIPINLPNLSDVKASPSTLFLYGSQHRIDLDGTADGMLLKTRRLLSYVNTEFNTLCCFSEHFWSRSRPRTQPPEGHVAPLHRLHMP